MRLDRLGRRIGYNWWREFVVETWFLAHQCWLERREELAVGYDTEDAEFALDNPRPTLKETMINSAFHNKEV